jgi:hypothetical protein
MILYDIFVNAVEIKAILVDGGEITKNALQDEGRTAHSFCTSSVAPF